MSRWRSALPELRIDPLSGLRTIVAGERAGRPGGEFSIAPRSPLDPETDPFLEGHEDRTPPELHALRPNGGAPNTPGWRVRVVPNLYPALADGGAVLLASLREDAVTMKGAPASRTVPSFLASLKAPCPQLPVVR